MGDPAVGSPASSAPEQAAAGTVGRDARRAGPCCAEPGSTSASRRWRTQRRGQCAGEQVFSSDPKRTSTAVAAAVAGWRAGGVADGEALPGLGGATVNTDDGGHHQAWSRS